MQELPYKPRRGRSPEWVTYLLTLTKPPSCLNFQKAVQSQRKKRFYKYSICYESRHQKTNKKLNESNLTIGTFSYYLCTQKLDNMFTTVNDSATIA